MRLAEAWRRLARTARSARVVARTARDSRRPLLAQIVPMRRCNLACGYCNEFTRTSAPVPLVRIERWLDRLAALGTAVVTCSGGEPLLHPHIVEIVRGVRARGMMSGMLTNGFLLAPPMIEALNDAGLDYLQISIDNVEPDGVSRKSLRLLTRQLDAVSRLARFDVNINAVVGGGTGHAADVRTIGARARALGFSMSVGVIHDHAGRLKPLSPDEREVWEAFNGGSGRGRQILHNVYSALNGFQRNLVDGRPNDWQCRAGARYLYISEEGLVGRCSQQRDVPGIPIEQYSPEDVQREYTSVKSCAPYCTIGCAHRVATLDTCLDVFRKPAASPRIPAGDPARPQPVEVR